MIFCLTSQFQGFIPFKYEIIKRYSKNITHLTIYEASISDNTRQYTSDNTRGIDILSSIKHEVNDQMLMDATTIQALIQILDSENGLDEIRLGGLFYDLKDHLLLRNPYRNRKPYDLNIYRDEFADTISILNQIKNKIIDADH